MIFPRYDAARAVAVAGLMAASLGSGCDGSTEPYRPISGSEQLTILDPGIGDVLDRPSFMMRIRISGRAPASPKAVWYRIGDEAEEPVLIFCEPVNECELYVAGLREGESRVTVRVESAAGNVLEATTVVKVQTRSLPYRLTYLGTLGEADSYPTDVNERGEVTGRASSGRGSRAFFHSNGNTTGLETPGADYSAGTAVNEDGLVGGYYGVFDRCSGPALWRPGASERTAGDCSGEAVSDITDSGAVLLKSCASAPPYVTVLERGTRRAITAPPEEMTCPGTSRISARSGVVAVEYVQTKGMVVWVLEPVRSMICPPFRKCSLGGVNDAGVVAISAERGSQYRRELYTWREGTLTRLGSFNANTHARAINGKEEVLAVDRHPHSSTGVPLLWRDGAFYVIEATNPSWIIDDVVEMNDKGQIIGHGRNTATAQVGAVLLDPVEP